MSKYDSNEAKANKLYPVLDVEYKNQFLVPENNKTTNSFLNPKSQSRVRRMARNLESNENNNSDRYSNLTYRESYNIIQPRSIDQLARFSSVSDLSQPFCDSQIRCQRNKLDQQILGNVKTPGKSWFTYDNSPEQRKEISFDRNLVNYSFDLKTRQSIRDMSQSLNQLHISSNEGRNAQCSPKYSPLWKNSANQRFNELDEHVSHNGDDRFNRKPCVIIKETIKAPRQTQLRLESSTNNLIHSGNDLFSEDYNQINAEKRDYNRDFEDRQPVNNKKCEPISKHFAGFPYFSGTDQRQKPVTLDELLLKSKQKHPSQVSSSVKTSANDRRAHASYKTMRDIAEDYENDYRSSYTSVDHRDKPTHDGYSCESGYLSDCCYSGSQFRNSFEKCKPIERMHASGNFNLPTKASRINENSQNNSANFPSQNYDNSTVLYDENNYKVMSRLKQDLNRNYSPQSTGSSMTSNSSGFSAPSSYTYYKAIPENQGQNKTILTSSKLLTKQASNDNGLSKNLFTRSDGDTISSDLPNFARHTKASKRRSKFNQSLSIPENLNLVQTDDMQDKTNFDKSSFINSSINRFHSLQNHKNDLFETVNFRKFSKGNSCKQPASINKSEVQMMSNVSDEREPEGEYHILKRWCESLRKYDNKSKNINASSTFNSPQKSNRNNISVGAGNNYKIKTNYNEGIEKMDELKKNTKVNQIEKPSFQRNLQRCQNNIPLNVKASKMQTDNFALSKAVSMDTLSTSNCPADDAFKKFGNIKDGYSGKNFGSTNTKFTTLDTVCEEIGQPEVVVKREKRPKEEYAWPMPKMNRYFSEANLSMQCQALGNDATCSDILVCREQMPLKYKRESWLKRYGTEESLNCVNPLNTFVELEPDSDPPFKRRIVVPRKDKRAIEEYSFGEFLGRGKFGEVKKCIEKRNSKELAAKFVPVRNESDRSSVYNEIEVMNSLQHPRLLQLYEAFDCGKEIVLIMELISGGELFERVIDDDFILTEILCELYVRQICEGISFMHKENFLHLDMKPENILCINRNGHRIKIIDFGLARKFTPGDSLRILFGTPEFVAPEVVSYEKIGQGTDLWSVGVICYVLLSGLSPFMGENDAETYNNINHVEYDFEDEAFEDISDDAKDFISQLLKLKPEDRMSAEGCLKHSWLTKHLNHNVALQSENAKINTKKLKRFVIRRRWQKAVNVLLALKRMGMSL